MKMSITAGGMVEQVENGTVLLTSVDAIRH